MQILDDLNFVVRPTTLGVGVQRWFLIVGDPVRFPHIVVVHREVDHVVLDALPACFVGLSLDTRDRLLRTAFCSVAHSAFGGLTLIYPSAVLYPDGLNVPELPVL